MKLVKYTGEQAAKLERERTEWMARYIEWNELGFAPEAKLALGYVRRIRQELESLVTSEQRVSNGPHGRSYSWRKG